MIYLSMFAMLPLIWFLPWWSLALAASFAGLFFGRGSWYATKFSVSSGIVCAGLAFIKDGHSHGLISRRLAGLLGLNFSPAIFLLVFAITFVTTFLCFRAGAGLMDLFKSKSVSENLGVSS